MKTPKTLEPLVEAGLIDEVMRPLKSGKEAAVYVVVSEGQVRCAKVYKEAGKRGFHKQAQYTEGRKTRNSRQARAMQKNTRYGQQQQEALWQNAEVDALYRLADAGIRVPKPHNFIEGVLLMELITDEDGNAAPRLNDLELSREQALEFHQMLIREVVKMLCAGIIHGDLSEYNILVDSHGPVIIDLPQAVDAAANNNAARMLERDVNNLATYFGQFAPELLETHYGKEIWKLFESGNLHPDVQLTGRFKSSDKKADVRSVMREIKDAREDAMRRRFEHEN
ncbi:PA4780 family RIO1-like protein kinase [Methylomicrobium sp. Wu6]|uniref:PA4780 family RIO1-like protein kinase n=1 Tax=Methylomicrobium sp. Wu6 TaxID=3107928 RepID=UPI002DD6B843|nr:PA4780 family RIO1-like protein kinase [Methylomicrobium sp. Wu6]MEC4746958.1 PA4780 family RIO1-like protein kinase [Methylomicrobium sp. Wu6]